MVKWVDRCRFTLIGKFCNAMPRVELIRQRFLNQTQVSRGVKIPHLNARPVYIDLDNVLDFVTV